MADQMTLMERAASIIDTYTNRFNLQPRRDLGTPGGAEIAAVIAELKASLTAAEQRIQTQDKDLEIYSAGVRDALTEAAEHEDRAKRLEQRIRELEQDVANLDKDYGNLLREHNLLESELSSLKETLAEREQDHFDIFEHGYAAGLKAPKNQPNAREIHVREEFDAYQRQQQEASRG